MGTIVRRLANHSDPSNRNVNIGSFNNLYRSVENLDAKYFETKECKDMLLNTRNSAEAQCRNLKINIDDTEPLEYFICEYGCISKLIGKNSAHVSTSSAVKCKDCGGFLIMRVEIVSSSSKEIEGVFVTKTSSFVISDDLKVNPDNPALTLGILESFRIKDFAVLEEDTSQLCLDEILDLLQCSFLSKSPLSDIYFKRKCVSLLAPTIESQTDSKCTDTKKMPVKLFVQKSSNKILLAICSQDFVDFLFSLLTFPSGRVISLINGDHKSPLSIENIHQSLLELNVGEYLKSEELKNLLLNPKLSMHYLCPNHIFPLVEETYEWRRAADGQYNMLSYLNSQHLEFTLQCRKGGEGFVAGFTKFMVTDDLVVTPSSSMSCLKCLHQLKVTPADIEEKRVDIGIIEALNLLRASMRSTSSVLTNRLKFLLKNPKQENSLDNPEFERRKKLRSEERVVPR